MKRGVARLDPHFTTLVIGTLILLPMPLFLSSFQMSVAVQILLFALLAVGWNVMGGFGGHFSFGHAAFFGIGAYATAYLLIHYHLSPWLGMLIGAALAAIFGVCVGFLSFRYNLKGVYFALATFAFAEILRLLANASSLVNASVGLSIPISSGSSWMALQFPENSPSYYYIALGLLVSGLLAVIFLVRSRSGWFTIALREDEDAASALGIHPMRYKLQAVAISAAITAVGGGFYVIYYFFINPDLAFGSAVSIEILLPAVLGGAGTIWGPVVGSFFIMLLSQYTTSLVRNPPAFLGFLQGSSGIDIAIYGLLLILLVLYLPRGIYGTLRSWVPRLFREGPGRVATQQFAKYFRVRRYR